MEIIRAPRPNYRIYTQWESHEYPHLARGRQLCHRFLQLWRNFPKELQGSEGLPRWEARRWIHHFARLYSQRAKHPLKHQYGPRQMPDFQERPSRAFRKDSTPIDRSLQHSRTRQKLAPEQKHRFYLKLLIKWSLFGVSCSCRD
jgi:hypothetical protein